MRGGGASARPLLLIGAGGQLGTEIAACLAGAYVVLPVSRADLNLERPEEIRALVRASRPWLVVNAAAYTAVDAAESDSVRCARINAIAPGVLAEETDRLDAPLLHFSTNYVFDGRQPEPYRDDAAVSPLNVYGATKAEGEIAVAAATRRHLILRTAAVYSTGRSNFLSRMQELAREREELRVIDDQFVSPTPAWLLAEATRTVTDLLRAERDLQGTFHVTTTGRTSWHAFATRILALDPDRAAHRARRVVAVSTSEYPAPARRPANGVLDVRRFERDTGMRLPTWDIALERTLCSAARHP